MIASPSIPFNPQMSAGGPLIAQLLAKLGAPATALPNVMTPGGGIGGGQTSGGGLSAGLPMPIGGPSTGPMAPIAAGTEPMPMGTGPSPIAPPLALNDAPIPGPGPVAPVDPSMAPPSLHRNLLQRVGDYLHQPGVAAALFRSGAATMQGGLGAGLEAGANYMDQRKASEVKTAQQEFDNAITTGRLRLDALTQQQKDHLAQMGIKFQYDDLSERSAHNQASEKLQGAEIASANMRNSQTLAQRERESLRQQIMDKYKVDINLVSDRESRDLQARLARDAVADGERKTAGIASRNPVGKITTPATKAVPGKSGWFSSSPDMPAQPGQETSVFGLPGNRADLVPGRVYQTPNGNARFNGSGFDKL